MAIVDELEVVEVEQQAGEASLGPRHAADLFVEATAHRAMVHAARHRIGPGFGARAQQRECAGGLVHEGRGPLRRELVELSSAAAHDHHDRLDFAADGKRQQQRTGRLAGRRNPRHRANQLARTVHQHTLAGTSDPRNPGRPLGAGNVVAQPAIPAEHVYDDRIDCRHLRVAAWRARAGRDGEVVDVDLGGREQLEQLAREHPHHGLRLGGAVGEPHQAA